jgi:D-xylose transport system substrate-binding protein
MRKSNLSRILALCLVLVMATFLFAGCGSTNAPAASTSTVAAPADSTAAATTTEAPKTIKIGMSVDDLRLERWQKDVNFATARAKEVGAELISQSANGDDQTQISQCENLISQGVNVLIIIAHNGEAVAPVIKEAHDAGIKVIAYERLIMNSDLDYYVTFDPIKVGEEEAKAVVAAQPKGNYFLLGGSPSDNNAKIYRQGQMNILQPLIDKGDIKVVGDQWAKDWLPEEALKIVENGLTANNNKIDAIVASNDSTAGGAVQALQAQGLAGKVPVSGQDADLAACQRVVEGTQTVTVYKPLNKLASTAVDLAMQIAKNEAITAPAKLNNNKIDVPTFYLDVVPATKATMNDTVIKDGFQKVEDVYKNVPKDQWPK